MHEKTYICAHMSFKAWGLQALADSSAKNVFFWGGFPKHGSSGLITYRRELFLAVLFYVFMYGRNQFKSFKRVGIIQFSNYRRVGAILTAFITAT